MGGRKPLSIFKAIHIVKRKPLSLQPCIQKCLTYIAVTKKGEEIRRQIFHNWPLPFIDKNHLAAAGFYYPNFKGVVCCAFFNVQLYQWKQEDNPFIELERWSPSCAFIKGLFVGI